MSHSPEPWTDADANRTKTSVPLWHPNFSIVDKNGNQVAIVQSTYDMPRIVACVNALAGIPTEVLESGDKGAIATMLVEQQVGSLADKVMAAIEADQLPEGEVAIDVYREDDTVNLTFRQEPQPVILSMDIESAVKIGSALLSLRENDDTIRQN